MVWASSLGSDRLYLDQQLAISDHETPAETLTVRVDAPDTGVELLFMPYDADASYTSLTELSCPYPLFPNICNSPTPPSIPDGVGVSYLHQGGAKTYYVGAGLLLRNGGFDNSQSIRSVYQRRHGECELEIKWESLIDQVFKRVGDSSGEAEGDDCNFLFCPNYDQHFDSRVGTSFLRRTSIGAGQGGFGLYVTGEVHFDSPAIDDLSFLAKVAYDVNLAGGLPEFSVAAGPYARTYDCSAWPTKCPHGDVQNGAKDGLKDAVSQLNDIVAECAAAPTEDPCEVAANCALTKTSLDLGFAAREEAKLRGFSLDLADQAFAAVRSEKNWRCAPVSSTCASLTGAQPTDGPVCQLELRALDLVPMPDSFSLVWYPLGNPVVEITAAEALYLALTFAGDTEQLGNLCSAQPLARGRAFVRRVDNTSH